MVGLIEDLLLPGERLSLEKLGAMQHGAAWSDVAAKAKRLVQEGKVTILRNAPHHVMAHVVGDGTDNGGTPDEHDVEISRHDPASQLIEQWNCDCAWAQYAWDRTRKWKKFEGRVCSHVLATYWKARSTPMDMSDQDEGFQAGPGQKAGLPGQQALPGMTPDDLKTQQDQQGEQDEQPGGLPDEDEGAPVQPTPPGQQPVPQSTQDLLIPKQPVSPYNVPKQPDIPQYQQLHLFDVTAPAGMQPTPMAAPVSVPGGSPPSPSSPVMFPGTFSHFLPVLRLNTSGFIYAKNALSEFFETQRAATKPIFVKITAPVALEQSGGKIPLPGATPRGVSTEGIPLYHPMELGWNPQTMKRENADTNQLQGAPEQSGVYSDVPVGRRAEVLDWDDSLKMAYLVVPLDYPGGEDARLHPHSLKGWVDYSDITATPQARTPWRILRG